jgi:hypothetical protein
MTTEDGPGTRPVQSLTRALLVVVVTGAVLVAISLILPRVVPWDPLRDPGSPLVRFIDVRAEANLHTWFNVAVLTVGAFLHAGVGVLARRAGRTAWPWAVTSLALALLAIDDMASLHEQLEGMGRALGAGEGALHFAWLLPGLLLAAGLALTAITVARHLPRTAGRWLLAGVAALLVAAVGLEAVGGAVLSSVGDGPAYILVSHLEEFVETCAAGILLCAAVSALQVRTGPVPGVIEVGYASPAPE